MADQMVTSLRREASRIDALRAARPAISLALGTAAWVVLLAMIVAAVRTIESRISRGFQTLRLQLPSAVNAQAGDAVYLSDESGLRRAGEVIRQSSSTDGYEVTLAVDPAAFERIRGGALATCWQTPLSAEDAMEMLLPEAIRRQAARKLSEAWEAQQDRLTELWQPIITDLAGRYLSVVLDDLQESLRRRDDEFLAVLEVHGSRFADRWPAMQSRINPVIATHLAPVLARLTMAALNEAPKVETAWLVAAGRHSEAFQQFSKWLGEYLEKLSDADRAELRDALTKTWRLLRDDEVLRKEWAAFAEGVFNDRNLQLLLADVYREVVTDNPRTIEFVSQIVASPEIESRFYDLVDTFAPTAKTVSAAVLFDAQGGTRPEAAYLLRSVSLGRSLFWVTLAPAAGAAGPTRPGDTIPAIIGGERR